MGNKKTFINPLTRSSEEDLNITPAPTPPVTPAPTTSDLILNEAIADLLKKQYRSEDFRLRLRLGIRKRIHRCVTLPL